MKRTFLIAMMMAVAAIFISTTATSAPPFNKGATQVTAATPNSPTFFAESNLIIPPAPDIAVTWTNTTNLAYWNNTPNDIAAVQQVANVAAGTNNTYSKSAVIKIDPGLAVANLQNNTANQTMNTGKESNTGHNTSGLNNAITMIDANNTFDAMISGATDLGAK